MKILVTGGAGFIGSHLTEKLLKSGNSVVVADNFSTGNIANLDAVKDDPKLQIVELDVAEDKDAVRQLVKESDVVIHLAAAVGVELVVNEPARTISTNVRGTENVLLPAVEFDKRIIAASTSEVYGKSTKEKFSESDDLLIGSPEHSRWSYACSKLLDEFYLTALVQTANLRGTVTRFFNTVGPRQTGMYGMVLPRFVRAALRNEDIPVYGDGNQSRCFCHVYDVLRALAALIDDERTYGQVYNIGSQHLVTIRELAELVIARTGSSSNIKVIPYEKAYAKGFEDMRRRMPDTDKIRALNNWQPEKSLEDIIDDVAESLRNE
ncbi:MAG: GDP-mannose 4,6-dehydratase [Lentisphaeria bacterium]|nr:GDP-mannose 4,6-dehydratase [Lentisphaeria bacterium]